MRNKFIILTALIIILIVGFVYFAGVYKSIPNKQALSQTKNMIKITSSVFVQGQTIPQKYTCDGEDINPPFSIAGIPGNIKSLVLIVDDPDSPSGTFTHWILLNINPATTEIKENSTPAGALSGKNDFGKTEYGGPCPGSGNHRYLFTIYALDVALSTGQAMNGAEVNKAIENHVIASGQLMGMYSR